MKKTSELAYGLELSEETLDKAVDLVEEHRDLFKKNRVQHLPAAAIHVASRLQDEPRSIKMIYDQMEDQDQVLPSNNAPDEREVRKAVKKLRKQYNLNPVRSKQYLDFIASQLTRVKPEDEAVERAEKYCETVEKTSGLSRSKVAIAGTCLKQAVEETREDTSVTHAELSEITGMHIATFKNNLKHFRENELLDT